MSDFNNETINQKTLDPYKRVKYSMGLVLGVDEFEQEQLYFLEKNRLHNRALHGYGTVCGLNVSIKEDKYEVVVTPGIAVAPAGQEIRVPATQCGDIKLWFDRNQDDLKKSISKEGTVKLYVVLCYRECEMDKVPVPGVPCRSQEESMVNSRIADDFELKLSLLPPPKIEEEIVRSFGKLLGRIEITPDVDPAKYTASSSLETMVRNLVKGIEDNTKIFLLPGDASSILRNAFRVFVTEVRPAIKGKEGDCIPPEGDCICLAKLDINVIQGENGISLKGEPKDIKMAFDDRPFLIHTRLLQEWLMCGKPGMTKASQRSFATLFTMANDRIRAWVHHEKLLDIQKDDTKEWPLKIEINGELWNIETVKKISTNLNVFDISFSRTNESPQKPFEPYKPFDPYNRFDKFSDSNIIESFGIKLDNITKKKVIPFEKIENYAANGDIITVYFESDKISEVSPGQKLLDAIDEMPNPYLERYGSTLKAHLIVDIPSLSNLSDVDISNDVKDGDVLVRRNGTWTSGKLKHNELGELEDHDDHKQYLPVDKDTRFLIGNLGAADHKITSLSKATASGDAVRWDEAITNETNAQDVISDKSDLSGYYPYPSVVKLRGKKLDTTLPDTDYQVLTWLDNAWKPKLFSLDDISDVNSANAQDGDVLTRIGKEWIPKKQEAQAHAMRYLPFVTITTMDKDGNQFELWFNIDAPENKVEITDLNNRNLLIFQENENLQSEYLKRIVKFEIYKLSRRNVYKVVLPNESDIALLRFKFILENLELDMNLFNWDKIQKQQKLSKKLIEFLKQNYGLDWVELADIKIETEFINLNYKENSLSIESSSGKVIVIINDVKTDTLITDNKMDVHKIMNFLEYSNKNGIAFMGFDGKDSITAFVKGRSVYE